MALPMLRQRALTPAGEDGVRQVIGRRFGIFPQPERDEGEWAAWWADYVDALADLPEGKLEAAMMAYIRSPDAEFMPKPGKLRQLSEEIEWTSPAKEAWHRAQAATRVDPTEAPPLPRPRADPAEVKSMLADFHRQFAERFPEKPKAEPRAVRGPTDDRGLTEAMRSHLSSQRA